MRPTSSLLARALIWIGSACLIYALGGLILGWSDFSSGLLRFPPSGWGPLIGLSLMNYGLRYWRWEIYLRRLGIAIPRSESAALFFATFAMVVTPAKLGEVYKALHLRNRHRIPVDRGLVVLVAERFYDVLAVLLLAAVGACAWSGTLGGVGLRIAAVTAGLLGLGFLRAGRLQKLIVSGVARAPALRNRGVAAGEILDRLRSLTTGGIAAMSVGVSVAAWVCECMGLWLVVRWLGAPIELTTAIFIYAAATLAGSASFLPGGLGGTEAVLILLLADAGVAQGLAVSAALVVRVVTLWLAVALGVAVFLGARGMLTPADGSVLDPVDHEDD